MSSGGGRGLSWARRHALARTAPPLLDSYASHDCLTHHLEMAARGATRDVAQQHLRDVTGPHLPPSPDVIGPHLSPFLHVVGPQEVMCAVAVDVGSLGRDADRWMDG